LYAQGHNVTVVPNLLAPPLLFSWRFDNAACASMIAWEEAQGHVLSDTEVEGVLVRSIRWDSLSNLSLEDRAYVQTEIQAAVLAWLWSLPCPVVNRYPAHIWFRSQDALLFWHPLLLRCGLPALETLVSNVQDEARAFGERTQAGALYAPLTSSARFPVTSERDWAGIAAMQEYAPVSLTPPYEDSHTACVIGTQVVWDDKPSDEFTSLELALVSFAAGSGLAFVEVSLASTVKGVRVTGVNPYPRLEQFDRDAQQQIATKLARYLTSGTSGKGNSYLLAAHSFIGGHP
jgi:hypothetical protein